MYKRKWFGARGAARGLLAALLAVGAAAATATPITYTFTGIVGASYADAGQTLSGSLTVDPAKYTHFSSNGTTSNEGDGVYIAPNPTPTQVSGSASDGTKSVAVGGGSEYDFAETRIARNGSNVNQFSVSGMSEDVGGSAFTIEVTLSDDNGAASTLFTNPSGGLDLTQPLDWQNEPDSFIYISSPSGNEYATLTSLTISGVPEPMSLALVGVALLGMAGSRRRMR